MSKPPGLPQDPDLPEHLAPAVEMSGLRDAELVAQMIEGVHWAGEDAQGLQLSECRLRGANLVGGLSSRGDDYATSSCWKVIGQTSWRLESFCAECDSMVCV